MAEADLIYGKGTVCFALTGSATHAAGESLGHIQNPEDHDIIITNCILFCTDSSTGAANLTVGTGTSATTGHDQTQLCGSSALAAAAGTSWVGFAVGDAADALVILDADDYIVACGDADTSGFAGYCFVEYLHCPENV